MSFQTHSKKKKKEISSKSRETIKKPCIHINSSCHFLLSFQGTNGLWVDQEEATLGHMTEWLLEVKTSSLSGNKSSLLPQKLSQNRRRICQIFINFTLSTTKLKKLNPPFIRVSFQIFCLFFFFTMLFIFFLRNNLYSCIN